jgi:hypothetical protein
MEASSLGSESTANTHSQESATTKTRWWKEEQEKYFQQEGTKG